MLKIAKKYILAFTKEKEEEVASLIEKEGCFELEDKGTGLKEEILQESEYLISVLSFAINYLNPFNKKTSIFKKIKNPKIFLDKNKENFNREEIIEKVKRTEEIEKELDLISRKKKELEENLKEAEKFGSLSFVPKETKHTFSFIISISKKAESSFLILSKEKGFSFRKISEATGKLLFALIVPKEIDKNFLSSIKIDYIQYNLENTPKKEIEISETGLKEKEKEERKLKQELIEIARFIDDFKVLHDILVIQKTKLEIKKGSLNSRFLNYIVFWAEEDKKTILEKQLLEISKEIIITELKTEEDPPVMLENNEYLKPFQYVTEIFGLPRAGEIDPTPYFFLFFILFFGISLTDAGYGFLLIILSAFCLLFLKNIFSDKRLIKLLFYGGISTLLMGIVFGSYFGVAPEGSISFLSRFRFIDPIKDTILFMGITFALGYLQLFFAQIVKIISGIKNKNKEFISGGISWILFYLSFLLFIIGTQFSPLKTFGTIGLLTSMVILIIVESSGQKIFLRPLIGIVKLIQGLINMMADILSYSRLMALGLATAVIALIINQIAFLFGSMVPYIGWLITGIILVGGHLFNLLINALSAFIHSGRLQFVEFFPKFLEGGGRRFKPTRSNLKYIKINK